MKKQYVHPTMEVVMINNSEPLLAGSALGVGGGTLDAGDALSPEMDDQDLGLSF